MYVVVSNFFISFYIQGKLSKKSLHLFLGQILIKYSLSNNLSFVYVETIWFFLIFFFKFILMLFSFLFSWNKKTQILLKSTCLRPTTQEQTTVINIKYSFKQSHGTRSLDIKYYFLLKKNSLIWTLLKYYG